MPVESAVAFCGFGLICLEGWLLTRGISTGITALFGALLLMNSCSYIGVN